MTTGALNGWSISFKFINYPTQPGTRFRIGGKGEKSACAKRIGEQCEPRGSLGPGSALVYIYAN